MTSTTAKVSVVMITYAHELYIQEAIESVLMQECDFEVELIVANDCSPDRTDAIVKDLIQTHPKGHWINYTRHETNKGMMGNFVWTLNRASSKYIALCEGDDYWTDPLKLQKQVDFLEGNAVYSMCSHQTESFFNHNKKISRTIGVFTEGFEILTTKDIIRGGYIIHTSSLVLRKNTLNFLEYFSQIHSGDIFLTLTGSLSGPIFVIQSIMSSYRLHEGGISKTKNHYRLLLKK